MSTRKFTRVRFNVIATIKNLDRKFQGTVKNLSMAGMFVATNEQFTDGETVDITIVLAQTCPEIAVHFTGIVTRTTVDGVGFIFEKMDLDSFIHLKNIISYNSGDSEIVMEEIFHSIDEKTAGKE